jgi:hypothetical protein
LTDTTQETQEPQVSPWLKVTLADIEGLDFQQVISGSNAADCQELSDLYCAASGAGGLGTDGSNDPAMVRVWDFLWGIAGMYFKPDETRVSSASADR